MDTPALFSPTTGWCVEAMETWKERGGSPYRAFDRVLLRYLRGGDVRPLLYLLDNGRRPGRVAQKYIAAMIDPKYRAEFQEADFLYELCFQENRKRGRPKSEQSDARLPMLLAILQRGADTIVAGRQPDSKFWNRLWHCLAVAHDPIQYRKKFENEPPLKAKPRRTRQSKGRVRDPELTIRDKALASFTSRAMAEGKSYEAALREVATENRVSKETARNAYTGAKRHRK